MIRQFLSRKAERDLKNLDSSVQRRIADAMDRYAATNEGDVVPLKGTGSPKVFRLRVGDWRVLFTQDSKTMTVARILHRGKAYQDFH